MGGGGGQSSDRLGSRDEEGLDASKRNHFRCLHHFTSQRVSALDSFNLS